MSKLVNYQLKKSPIAIIGMSCLFPTAKNLQDYWKNIISKVDCITDVPASRWSIHEYYDPDPAKPDKTYSKRGGFIPDVDFNPVEFGLPPNILEVTDVSQMLSLVVAKQAMEDAGYGESRDFNRDQVGVILGATGAQKLFTPLTSRLQYPVWKKVLESSGLSEEDTENILEKIKLAYIKWEDNSFPGMLGNVIAGRIANRLNLGGINCVVDAACASSLSALRMAVSELTEYRSDMMITGGVDTDNSILMYMCFSKTPAFSKKQQIRPFDAESDGMLIGEGIGMMVLKRLEDAQKDGDRIYAVIKGIGTSSDGKYKSIYAPRSSGQAKALRRAYTDAGFTPSTVGLIEAHGTGTMAGDPAEFAALKEVFSENNPEKQQIALGSIKSQIGHTKAAAGAASLIKTALALHHKILPATINITTPNPQLKIEDSPFYLNTETRPWIRSEKAPPRRAGVSSFGFGGTNYHVVLEEYSSEQNQPYRLHNNRQEIVLFADNPAQLLNRCQTLLAQLKSETREKRYVEVIEACKSVHIATASARVGFVAETVTEACEYLDIIIEFLQKQPLAESWEHPQGIYYRKTSIAPQAKVVALFSGQGSQYLEMGKELAINFPILRQVYGYMDSLLLKDELLPISQIVFPPPAFEKVNKDAQLLRLQRTENAQPAIAAFSVGLYKILQQAGFKPDFVAGHSFGELTALWCAEVLQDEDYFYLAKTRGQAMASPPNSNSDVGGMLAVTGDINKLQKLIADFPQITIANWNSNNQVVLAGSQLEINKVQQLLDTHGYAFVLLPVSAAFHTPLVSYSQKPFDQAIKNVTLNKPKIPVFSNITGQVYPQAPEQIRQTLAAHIINPVLFRQEIENIYAAGGYCFVEFGPRNILTNLVKNILGDRPHLAIAVNPYRPPSTKQPQIPIKDSDRLLREAVVQLRVAGLPLGELDPYALELRPTNTESKKGLNIVLSGSNYVSDKTKIAFEKALQNGQLVTSLAHTKHSSGGNGQLSTNNSHFLYLESRQQTNEQTEDSQMITTTSQNIASAKTTSPVAAQAPPSIPQTPVVHPQPMTPSTEQTHLSMPQFPMNDHSNIDSFERLMMRYYEHQAEVLHLHEQCLKNQEQSSQRFFQLMQQYTAGQVSVIPATNESSLTEAQPTQLLTYTSSNGHHDTANEKQKQCSYTPRPELEYVSISNTVTDNDPNLIQPNLIVSNKDEAPEIASPVAVTIDLAPLTQSLLEVVSEKTGYPAEMLELNMDMEADLGIDSIKKVEILAAMQERFPDLPAIKPEELGELRTLAEIVEYMGNSATMTEKKTLIRT